MFNLFVRISLPCILFPNRRVYARDCWRTFVHQSLWNFLLQSLWRPTYSRLPIVLSILCFLAGSRACASIRGKHWLTTKWMHILSTWKEVLTLVLKVWIWVVFDTLYVLLMGCWDIIIINCFTKEITMYRDVTNLPKQNCFVCWFGFFSLLNFPNCMTEISARLRKIQLAWFRIFCRMFWCYEALSMYSY